MSLEMQSPLRKERHRRTCVQRKCAGAGERASRAAFAAHSSSSAHGTAPALPAMAAATPSGLACITRRSTRQVRKGALPTRRPWSLCFLPDSLLKAKGCTAALRKSSELLMASQNSCQELLDPVSARVSKVRHVQAHR